MQLDTITMDRNDARRAFIEYRTAVRARHDHEDEAIMRAYRAASRGAALIRLGEVLGSGGITTCDVPVTRWDGKRKMSVEVGARPVELPALAVARADVLAVWTSGINSEGGCELRYTPNQITERSRERHVMANGTFPAATRRRPDQHWRPRIRAMAPNIPPQLRPAYHLRNFHLLWEAQWELDRSVPPGDPALLKHLGGDLYAVLAVWDLTPIEQAVLAGTRA
jgi:hypothetical protein